MCTSPIHIKRPKTSYLQRLAYKTEYKDIHISNDDNIVAYDVPCGKCAECQQQKISDYVVRCYDEWIRSHEHAIFTTLTYNDAHIPFIERCIQDPIFLPNECVPWEYEIIEEAKFNYVSTWWKPHVTKFLKQLQEKLIYYIGTELLGLKRLITENGHRCISTEWKNYLSSSPRPLKYIVTCERGSADIYLDDNGRTRQGTSRPHYHCIFFLNDARLYGHLDFVFQLVKELWTYGNTYDVMIEHSSEGRTPTQCIEYVCKYVFKDMEETTLNCLFYDYQDKLNRKPFLLVSNGLGEHLLDDVDPSVVINNGYTLPTSNGQFRSVNPPRYNVLKKTTYRISGVVSDNNIHSKYDTGLFYDGGHPSPYFFIWDEDVKDILGKDTKKLHIKVIKTELGKQLDIENRVRKAQYYANQLQMYQYSQSIKELWKESDSPLIKRNYDDDIQLLFEVNTDDLYLFILNDLYIHTDQYDNPDQLYQCYELIRAINNTIIIHHRKKRELEYKKNLEKALQAKPKLFSCKPL